MAVYISEMQAYGHGSTEAGIVAFEIHDDSIEIEFEGGWVYEFTYASAGVGNVECMKALARSGHGLSNFVHTNMSGSCASKTRAPMFERGLW